MKKDPNLQTIPRNILLLIIVVLAVLILLIGNSHGNSQTDNSGIIEINGLSQAGENQQLYTNAAKKFSIIIPQNLKTIENDNQIDFLDSTGASGITVNIFTDSTQNPNNTYLTQTLCDKFGSEFNKSITKEPSTPDFTFILFKLNGKLGCEAVGSVKRGVQQKIYVVLSQDGNQYYAVYYLANSDAEAKTFEESINSFRLN